MEQKKSSGLQENLHYICLVLALLMVVLAYVMVYSPSKTEITDLEDEVEVLENDKDNLDAKIADEKKYKEEAEQAEKEFASVLKKFDGGISQKNIIMYNYNLAGELGIEIKTIEMGTNEVCYTFGGGEEGGKLVGSNVEEGFEITGSGAPTTLLPIANNYSITATGTYEQIKTLIAKIRTTENKRKVIRSVGYSFDSAANTVTANISLVEYAIEGTTGEEDAKPRKETMYPIPATIATGVPNLFFGGAVAAQ